MKGNWKGGVWKNNPKEYHKVWIEKHRERVNEQARKSYHKIMSNPIRRAIQNRKDLLAQNYRRERRKNHLIYWLGGKCQECNRDLINELHSLIHFHHPDNNKEAEIGQLLTSGSLKRLMKEVRKCQMLCYDCHRNKDFVTIK